MIFCSPKSHFKRIPMLIFSEATFLTIIRTITSSQLHWPVVLVLTHRWTQPISSCADIWRSDLVAMHSSGTGCILISDSNIWILVAGCILVQVAFWLQVSLQHMASPSVANSLWSTFKSDKDTVTGYSTIVMCFVLCVWQLCKNVSYMC